MDDDRVSTLEQQFAKMEAWEVDIQQKLELLLSHALQKPVQPLPTSPVPVPADSIPRTDVHHTARVAHPANPPEFNRDRSKCLAFLNSCQTYARLCPEEFPDDQTKIIWAMSYMKADRAQKWTAQVFRWEQQADSENSGQNKFLDWEDFREEFRKEFTPSHADTLAINRLESNGYYQKNRSLDDYVDEFQDLIVDSGYTDPKTIVVKFRRGLNTQIQNTVATMASGRPSDASPEQWYNMARTVDQNRAANEAFSSMYRSPVPSLRPVATSVIRPAAPSVRAGHSHIHPTPGNPVPMDLDTTRGAATTPLCFRCKKPGHFGRDCPTQIDVRSMTIDELQEALGLRLAELDVVPSDPSLPEQTEENEDF
jgi:hypothetical protein